MTKSYGNLPAGDKSQYPDIHAKSGRAEDVVKSPGKTKKPVKPEVWNPTGVPTRFLQKKSGQ